MKDLKDLVRPNVWNLKPYSSARDEFHGDASVFLTQMRIRGMCRITVIPIPCSGN